MAHLLACALDVGPCLPYLMPALNDRAAGTWVFDFEQKIFAKDAAAHDAHRRGRVVAAQQGVLAATERDIIVTRVSEPSELVRGALCRCLSALVATAVREGAARVLYPYLHDIIMLAHAFATDVAPHLRQAGARLVVALAAAAPDVVKHYAVALVRSLMVGGLDHRHARLRLASLDAVDALVSCVDEAKGRGAGTEAILHLLGSREANVVPISAFYTRDTTVNYFAKLVIDNNAYVCALVACAPDN
jgi:hypothetical protein